MSTPPDMPLGPDGEPVSEEELRAAYEAQLKQLRVEDVVVQTLVSLINLAGRKAGLAPGTEDERDPEQLRMAIDGSRALLALVEDQLGPDAASLKDALSQLQMAYVQMGGTAPEATPDAGGGAGQAPPSRLWVPGQ
ncbi:hypothetical protein GKE82_00915 [Conexibacter sp. W3-3-2]|uniref:DUF1844 domain-containing protein n=1 Tax=Paraconexibacter algicola TaxID=2133960 RepID=A0A2T4UEH7_9ACTN|nr:MULTISPECIES: hypothetical protein [Solirubrobacterales]MTD42901.1 hypothetical protein [Conexibacter sp. W3-3-2]PTL56186.1 hypothetical protein C7Y72_14440 [Paraconexibacter algicola]